MFFINFKTVISILFLNCVLWCSAKSNNINLWNHLSTRTPYRFMVDSNDFTNSTFQYPGCAPKKIWMLIRHGTRYPSADDILGMNDTLDVIRKEILQQNNSTKNATLNPEELEIFRNWETFLNADDAKLLAYEGEEEMVLLAERIQHKFPTLLPETYSNETYKFRYTATQRTQQSAKFFTIGLFNRLNANKVWYPPALKKDPVLRFYKLCKKWKKEVKKNSMTYEEQNLFGESSSMQKTLLDLTERLNLDEILTLDDVELMYKICGFETAWFKNKLSPWCMIFELEEIQMLEYYHDLKHYWVDSYGYEITYRQACVAVKDMFNFFLNEDEATASFLFTHSGTIIKTLTYLGLYKPHENLKHDNYEYNKFREWRTSFIDTFAANLAFVKYRCGLEDYILAMHQERVIRLNGCEEDLCPMEQLFGCFHDSISKCDLGEICNLND